MDFKIAIVLDEAHFPELVQKKADAGAGGANHVGQRFLANFWKDRLFLAFFTEVRQQKQHARQPLFTGIEELIHQIRFNPDVT